MKKRSFLALGLSALIAVSCEMQPALSAQIPYSPQDDYEFNDDWVISFWYNDVSNTFNGFNVGPGDRKASERAQRYANMKDWHWFMACQFSYNLDGSVLMTRPTVLQFRGIDTALGIIAKGVPEFDGIVKLKKPGRENVIFLEPDEKGVEDFVFNQCNLRRKLCHR